MKKIGFKMCEKIWYDYPWGRRLFQYESNRTFNMLSSFPGLTGESRLIMEKNFYVYILASQRNGTLYVGVTSDLIKRVWEHKRKWKIDLIEKANPDWKDLYEDLTSGFPDQVGE